MRDGTKGLKFVIAGSTFFLGAVILMGFAYLGNKGNDFVDMMIVVFGVLGLISAGYGLFFADK